MEEEDKKPGDFDETSTDKSPEVVEIIDDDDEDESEVQTNNPTTEKDEADQNINKTGGDIVEESPNDAAKTLGSDTSTAKNTPVLIKLPSSAIKELGFRKILPKTVYKCATCNIHFMKHDDFESHLKEVCDKDTNDNPFVFYFSFYFFRNIRTRKSSRYTNHSILNQNRNL